VPHKGWHCVEVEDLEEPAAICEMCEHQEIRYVHTMEHPDHEPLRVGCVCAEHMEEDYSAPKERERQLANRANRRKRWCGRTWRTSRKGNLMLKTDGLIFVIVPTGRYFQGKVLVDERWVGGSKRFKSLNQLKLVLFDYCFPRKIRTDED